MTATAEQPAPVIETEDAEEHHQLDHVRALFTQTPATLTGNAVGLGLVLLLFAGAAEPVRLAVWCTLVSVLLVLRLLHYLRYRRNPRADDATLRRWRLSWKALVLLQGAMWGIAAWLFWGLGTPYDRLALLLIVYSYCLGSVQLLSTQWRVFLAFISLVLVPTILRVATDTGQPGHWQLAGILTLLFGITVLMARTAGSALGQAIRLKSRTDALALQLRVEKAEADAARRAAEAANDAGNSTGPQPVVSAAAAAAPPPPSPLPSPPVAPAVPVVDQAVLDQLEADTDHDVLGRVVQLFVEESRVRLDSIDAALTRDDWKTLQREAHTLKSSAGTFGARQLQEHARQLNDFCRAGQLERARELALSIRAVAVPALIELDRLFPRR